MQARTTFFRSSSSFSSDEQKGKKSKPKISEAKRLEKSKTLLILCKKSDDVDVIRGLLEKGADPNYIKEKTQYRKTYTSSPLYRAITHGNDDIVEVLLECGADPNQTIIDKSIHISDTGPNSIRVWRMYPLAQAIIDKREAIAVALINAGADVNCDCGGIASLYGFRKPMLNSAIQSGFSKDTIQLMVDKGASLDKLSVYPNEVFALFCISSALCCFIPAMIYACSFQLFANKRVNNPQIKYRTPLEEAEKVGNQEVIDYLVSLGLPDVPRHC